MLMSDVLDRSVTRRSFIRGGIAAVGGVATAGGLAAFLEACATSPSPTTTTGQKRGGILRIGSHGSNVDVLDYQYGKSDIDAERGLNLYDGLTHFEHASQKLVYALAESITYSDAQTMTIRLRSGVEFHNGKSLTADDLIFSLQRILNPSKFGSAHSNLAAIDPNALTKVDPLTVKLNLKFPDSTLPQKFYQPQACIVPVGFDPANPVGTGPFKYKSFTPGQRSDMVRNPNYWIQGQPYVDELIVIDFPDDTARVNALLGGQIDALDSLPAAQVPIFKAKSDFTVLTTHSGFYEPIVMRVDQAPWTDVRVRQAFRLIANRDQMVSQGYSGFGRIGNDMACPYDPSYPTSLPQRQQDIAQAKSLLKAAGRDGMTITMTTAPESPGLIETAQVFAANAKDAGVTVNIDNINPTQFDNTFPDWNFTQGYWTDKPFAVHFALNMLPGAVFAESHWNDAQTFALYKQALATVDPAKQTELFTEIQTTLYNTGGYIVHSFKDQIDCWSNKLTGYSGDAATGFGLGQFRFREVSFK
jgi:peptide/nickel transport system substrate-binding protein